MIPPPDPHMPASCSQPNGRIPQHCADQFGEIQRELGGIAASQASVAQKLDDLAARQRTFGDRAWSVIKGLALLTFGWLLKWKTE